MLGHLVLPILQIATKGAIVPDGPNIALPSQLDLLMMIKVNSNCGQKGQMI